MAQKLITLEEAARILGVSTDELNAMRERREVFGYRDGSTWKFKPQDIERLAEERRSGGGADQEEYIPLAGDDEGDAILLSEVELGESDSSMSGTVIGKPGSGTPEDSDVQLVESNEKQDSDLRLASDDTPSFLAGGSDVKIAAPSGGPASSHVDTAGGSDLELNELELDDGSDLPLALDGSGTGSSAVIGGGSGVGSDLSLGSDVLSTGDSFPLAEDGALTLAEGKANQPASGGSGSDIELAGGFEDDDLVLGSPTGSDLSDSGISLGDPADSGLSLEQPLELGAEEFLIDEGEEPAGELTADDEFLLTPSVEMGEEDLDESGSQVIALDTEGDFDDSAATLLGEGQQGLLEEDLLGEQQVPPAFDPLAGAAAMGAAGAPLVGGMPTQPVVAREAPYSVWNVLGLMVCTLVLMLTGMMMFDLILNIWSWDQPYQFNSMLMDSILSMIEG